MSEPRGLSQEQSVFRDAVSSGKSCKGAAYAGTGKTTATVESAAANRARGLYVTFNRAPADEARPKFRDRAPHVRVASWHQLAFRAIGKHYHHRLQERPAQLRAALEEYLSEHLPKKHSTRRAFVTAVAETIRQFELSADHELGESHVPVVVQQTVLGEFKDYIARLGQMAWRNIVDPFGVVPVSHDAYFKIWALGEPQLKTGVLYCDEWQDTNPVMASVVAAQRDVQLVLMGDQYQAIYGWRGAVDALRLFDLPEFPLTVSWRFGPEIAGVATLVLRALGAPLPLVGGAERGIVRSSPAPISPSGVIARTNAGLVEACLWALDLGRATCVLGGAERVAGSLEGLYQLWTTGSSAHPDFRIFSSFSELLEIAQSRMGAQYRPYIRLLQRYSHDLPQIAARLGQETLPRYEADLLVGTPHQWKGDETGIALLWGDFGPFATEMVNPETDLYEPTIDEEEAHVAYVALTRARSMLLLGSYADTLAESLVVASRVRQDTSIARDGSRLVPSEAYQQAHTRPSALAAHAAMTKDFQRRT